MTSKTISRRNLLQAGVTLSAVSVAVFSGLVHADWPQIAYAQKSQNDAMDKLLGNHSAEESNLISLKIPEIAENGAVVPVNIQTELSDVKSVSIFVENNPNPLAARFNLGPSQQGKISTRIKLAKETNVTAVVETEKGLFRKTRFVKVTLGGCGG